MDFLDATDILMFHADQVALDGGEHGVRDLGLRESAVAQPQATLGGEFLRADVLGMAAATSKLGKQEIAAFFGSRARWPARRVSTARSASPGASCARFPTRRRHGHR